ncbi:MAG: cytochrome C [Gammaproteobacteria bacterium]|nr:MAG: cytochrome C [Gammaproteobacteria bacterium]
MKRSYILLAGLAIILAGCEPQPNTGKGFSLPEGDASIGKITFVELGCNTCHSIADIEQLPRDDNSLPHVKLGGSVSTIKSYGELVTSIINPSHKVLKRLNQGTVMAEDGSSTMRVYNDIMTVSQLVNLVTFLEDNYEVIPYKRTVYYRVDSIH